MAVLSASQDAEDDVVELLGRTQEASLDGAAGDLDEGPACGHKAQMATHAHYHGRLDDGERAADDGDGQLGGGGKSDVDR